MKILVKGLELCHMKGVTSGSCKVSEPCEIIQCTPHNVIIKRENGLIDSILRTELKREVVKFEKL